MTIPNGNPRNMNMLPTSMFYTNYPSDINSPNHHNILRLQQSLKMKLLALRDIKLCQWFSSLTLGFGLVTSPKRMLLSTPIPSVAYKTLQKSKICKTFWNISPIFKESVILVQNMGAKYATWKCVSNMIINMSSSFWLPRIDILDSLSSKMSCSLVLLKKFVMLF